MNLDEIIARNEIGEPELVSFYPQLDDQVVIRHMNAKKLGIRIWQHPLEFQALYRRLPVSVKWVLEIGTAQGGWPYWIGGLVKPPVHFCLVDPQDPVLCTDAVFNEERMRVAMDELRSEGHTVMFIKDTSLHAVAGVREWLGSNELDILHIDADHDVDNAFQDYLLYHSLVRPGGIIPLHDVRTPGGVHLGAWDLYDLLSQFEEADLLWNEGINHGIGLIYHGQRKV